jgi:hypothetical protein
VGVLVVIVVIAVVVGVLVLVHDVVVVDIIYMYIIYIYYIYISVCACMNISGKMNIKHHIDMILIFKEYQTFMILITFFFKKLSSDFAYFAGRSGLERKGPSFRCGRCRSLGALTARRLEVKDPRQSKRRR